MKTGLTFLGLGILMLLYSYISFKRASNSLSHVKEEDLVSYYLDLALKLLPGPFWSAISGILVIIMAIIILLINIPIVF